MKRLASTSPDKLLLTLRMHITTMYLESSETIKRRQKTVHWQGNSSHYSKEGVVSRAGAWQALVYMAGPCVELQLLRR